MFALKDAPSRAKRVIRSGDILVSTVRPNLRTAALVPFNLDGEVASTGFAVLRATPEILSKYIWAIVRSQKFTEYLLTRVTGSNYPAVKASDIGNYIVDIPPIEEQQHIVDIIDSVDEMLQATQTTLTRTHTVRQSVLSDLLSGEHEIPDSYDNLLEAV